MAKMVQAKPYISSLSLDHYRMFEIHNNWCVTAFHQQRELFCHGSQYCRHCRSKGRYPFTISNRQKQSSDRKESLHGKQNPEETELQSSRAIPQDKG